MDLLNNQQIKVNHLIFYMHQLLCLIKACDYLWLAGGTHNLLTIDIFLKTLKFRLCGS